MPLLFHPSIESDREQLADSGDFLLVRRQGETDGAPAAVAVSRHPAAFERPEDPAALHVFVPGHLAAVCADCDGYFVVAAGRCPGCGSAQWMPVGGLRRVS